MALAADTLARRCDTSASLVHRVSIGPAPERAITHAPILLPSELVDDKAWIWADLLTGSLWYYANKPAFKIQFTDEENARTDL